MLGNSWVAAELATSQEGHSCMSEWYGTNVFYINFRVFNAHRKELCK
jgi:hypothetical protein